MARRVTRSAAKVREESLRSPDKACVPAGSYRPSSNPADWRGHAVLEIPVPQLEPFVRARTRFYDPGFVSDDPRFCHAHITLLAPFFELPDRTVVERVVATMQPFDFGLDRIAVFPSGMIHLVPEPSAVFRRSIHAFIAAFPQVAPYGGEDPEPHLSLDVASPGVTVASTRALLGGLVPARCRARCVDLCWYESGACSVIERWELG